MSFKWFNFDPEITRMDDKGILYIVLQEFTSNHADFYPDHISNIEMGYVFEEIIRKFSESSNEDAGQHYTPREVLPFVPDAWVDHTRTTIGYEIPFTRYFYHYEPPRPAAEIAVDIRALAQELDGSLATIFQD